MPKADIPRVVCRVFGIGCGLVFSLCLSGMLTGCLVPSGASDDGASVEVGSIAAPVVGGESADACEWPSTVSVNAWGSCTGTLIHPRVITTAAHCIQNGKATIYFGENRNTPGAFSLDARCEVGAQGSRGANTSHDWAYCVLPEDDRVKKLPVTPPLIGCEADKFLKAGLHAWVVGFGTTSAFGMGAGTKRQVEVVINALNKAADGTIDVGDAQQGACHGDSGGPLYVHLVDGQHDWGYRVVGSTSGAGAPFCDCSCSTVYVNIANHVKAIEEKEHIDVTPCTDADGKFDPSPACASLLTSPQDGTGTFPACTVKHTTEPINSCGTLVVPSVAGQTGQSDSAAGSGGESWSGGAGAAGQPAAAATGAAGGAAGGAAAKGVVQPGAVAGATGAPNVAEAINAVTMPAAAFHPATSTGMSAAGHPAIASETFSSTAAGGPAPSPTTPSGSSSSGCQVAAAGAKANGSAWFTAFVLCALWGLRMRRRGAYRLQSRRT